MASAYDPVRGRTILFGGSTPGVLPNTTFTLALDASGPHWTKVLTPVSPPPRNAASLVYDSARDRVLLFGGVTAIGVGLNDVWALSLTAPMTWTQLSPSGSIPGGGGNVVIYDSVRDRLLAMGAFSGLSSPNEVWQLPLSGAPAWTQLSPAGTPPLARIYAVGAYDPERDRVLLFGGSANVGGFVHPQNDTWELRLAGTPTWNQLSPSGTPPAPRRAAGGFYDPVHDQLVVFGGQLDNLLAVNDTYGLSLGASPAWSNLSPAGAPPAPRLLLGMVYDPAAGRGVVVGGDPASNHPLFDVWRLELAPSPAWVAVGDVMGPGYLESAAGVYDSLRKRFVLFGGLDAQGSTFFNGLWGLAVTPGGVWGRIGTGSAASPGGRPQCVLAFDAVHDRILLFGGGYQNDAWSFDNATETWSQLAPSGTPPSGRSGAGGFYDAGRDRLVIFGGLDASDNLRNDAWELDFQPSPHWSPIAPAGVAPSGRTAASVVYDAARDRMLVFGGGGATGGGSNDLWQLRFSGTPTWSLLSPFGQIPSGRQGAGAVVDPVRHRMVVFGGRTGDGAAFSQDAFALDLVSDPPGWTQLAPTYDVPGPSPRGFAATAYDALNDRLLVYGGRGIDASDMARAHTLDGAFALAWGEPPTPTLLAFADEQTGAGTVRLTWYTPDGPGQAAVAQRSADGVVWETIAALTSDAAGEFVLTDAVAAGGRYAYRLGIGAPGDEQFTDAHWTTIPAGVAFGITGTGANPSRGALPVAFALPTAGAASLDLYDIAGRRLVHRDVSALGAGVHTLDLAGERSLGSGVYWVRLEQGARVARRKVAIVR